MGLQLNDAECERTEDFGVSHVNAGKWAVSDDAAMRNGRR